MLIRAFCYGGGVKTTDHKGRERGFSFDRSGAGRPVVRHAPARVARPFHSESECEGEGAEVIRAFGDDGALGLAVLPPGFRL